LKTGVEEKNNRCYIGPMAHPTPVEALLSAIDILGSQTALANALSKRFPEPVSPARVWNWINRDGGVPSEFCPDIEDLTGVKCEHLCPGTNWPVLRKRPRRAAAKAS
jgi:DNA-binding transcriptional regulator YdaS (Cro superfamily)